MGWFLLAFVAPVLWAWVAVIDTYFVHGVYEDALDGAVISGIFQSVPWMLVPLGVVGFTFPGSATAFLALASGGLFLLSFFYYFRALFVVNDSALMQVLWNLSVPMVPFIAWLLIGERLSPNHYAGVAVAFLGVALFGLDAKTKSKQAFQIALTMAAAVTLFSLSMVVGKKAYLLTGDDFWSVFLLFSSGASLMAVLLLAFQGRKSIFGKAHRILGLSRRFFFLFVIAEGLSVVATITSQRAISLAPAVSYIAVIESLVPVFVMFTSLFLVGIFRLAGRRGLESAYREQFANLRTKILAIGMIAGGIYAIA